MAIRGTVLDLGQLGEIDARLIYDHEPADPAIGWPEYIEIRQILVCAFAPCADYGQELDMLGCLRALGGDKAIDAMEMALLRELHAEREYAEAAESA